MVGAFVFVTDILFGQLAAMVAGAATAAMTLILWGALPLARRRALGGTRARGAGESSGRSATTTPG
jgi:hypothetical protein